MTYSINSTADYLRYFLTQVKYTTPDKSKVSINPNLDFNTLQTSYNALYDTVGEQFIDECRGLELSQEEAIRALRNKVLNKYRNIAKIEFCEEGMADDEELLANIDITLNILKNELGYNFKKAPKVKFVMEDKEWKGRFTNDNNLVEVNMLKCHNEADACITMTHELTHKYDYEKMIGFNFDGSLGEIENPRCIVPVDGSSKAEIKKIEKKQKKYLQSINTSLFYTQETPESIKYAEEKKLADEIIREYEKTTFFKCNKSKLYYNSRTEILSRLSEVYIYKMLGKPDSVAVQLMQETVEERIDTAKLENDAWVINNLPEDFAFNQLKQLYPHAKTLNDIKAEIKENYERAITGNHNYVVSNKELDNNLNVFSSLFHKYVKLLNKRK